MCPIVPTLQCGLLRSNFSFAICVLFRLGLAPPSPSLRHRSPESLLFSYPGLPPWAKLFAPTALGSAFNAVNLSASGAFALHPGDDLFGHRPGCFFIPRKVH